MKDGYLEYHQRRLIRSIIIFIAMHKTFCERKNSKIYFIWYLCEGNDTKSSERQLKILNYIFYILLDYLNIKVE